MNIFVLDEDPLKAARMLCDQHCNKMVLESAQMLANCFDSNLLSTAPLTKSGNIRKHSYYNHPCSKWVRESRSNMRWLIFHALSMEQERITRGFKPHFCIKFVEWCDDNVNQSDVPEGPLTPFAVAIPQDAKCRSVEGFCDLPTVQKYRQYYLHDKAKFAKFTRNNWLDKESDSCIIGA